jgi:hypothetical protein
MRSIFASMGSIANNRTVLMLRRPEGPSRSTQAVAAIGKSLANGR